MLKWTILTQKFWYSGILAITDFYMWYYDCNVADFDITLNRVVILNFLLYLFDIYFIGTFGVKTLFVKIDFLAKTLGIIPLYFGFIYIIAI